MSDPAGPVLFMCSALGTGGAERQWSVLLPALAEKGFEPRVLTLVGRGRFFDEIQARDIPVDCAEMRNRYDLARAWTALARVEGKPDLVVTQETNAHLVGHAVATRARIGHIAVDHTPRGLARSLHRRMLVRLIAKRVDCVVGVSRTQIPDLVRVGFPKTRIRIIYNGVPALTPTQTPEEARASIGVGSDEFVALMVAALRPQKRGGFFVESIVAANRLDARIRGVIAGGGPELEHVRALAEQTPGVVKVLGERSDIADLMQAADVVCLTSWTEGLPMVLLEAMSLGCTIVATDVAGTDEVIIHGETGILVPTSDPAAFAEAIWQLSHDLAGARALGQAAKARYQRLFTAERMATEYADLFSSFRSAYESRRS